MNPELKSFPNLYYMESSISEGTLKLLKKEFNNIKNNKNKRKRHITDLTGNGVTFHYELSDKVEKIFINEVSSLIKKYAEETNYVKSMCFLTKDVPLSLDKPWMNLQKKYEFIPNHVHDGVLSYSCWINVPYDLDKELKNNERLDYASLFQFSYSNILGAYANKTLPIDKTWEGKIIVFPAGLTHCVYPFYTSNDYRVSVSGNASFLINE
jgi:hypothetical protein